MSVLISGSYEEYLDKNLSNLPKNLNDVKYKKLEKQIAARFACVKDKLFLTEVKLPKGVSLFDVYLSNLSSEFRQTYNCRCCRDFINKYGCLVNIDSNGLLRSPLWELEGIPDYFRNAVEYLHNIVVNSPVIGVFVPSEQQLGNAIKGNKKNSPAGNSWTHLHGTLPKFPSEVSALKTADQVMAEKKEDYGMLQRALSEYSCEAVYQAIRVLETENSAGVIRTEKTIDIAKWFRELHTTLIGKDKYRQNNLIWKSVADAPAGWCHIKTTMLSALLDDIILGLPFETIRAKWNAKMHPLQYMRPSVAVSTGTITQANKIVEKLGSEGALKRRYATLDDILSYIWLPNVNIEFKPYTKYAGMGPFSHLKKPEQNIKEVILPPQSISFVNFSEKVLPNAKSIECYIGYDNLLFYGLITAVEQQAQPILQWDGLEGFRRNPCSWYFINGGSSASQWNLTADKWVSVTAIFEKPNNWQRPDLFKHQGGGIFFSLASAKPMHKQKGGSFFPESLKSEYHSIRSAMESYSNNATIEGVSETNACGICLGTENELHLRVNGGQVYKVKG